ncbi:hypothetical protein ACTQ2W_08330, partial [Ligilactobacillus ruminis]
FVCPPSIILLGDLIIPGRRALGSLFFINLHHYTGITRKRRFARKRELGFTGRFEKTAICP